MSTTHAGMTEHIHAVCSFSQLLEKRKVQGNPQGLAASLRGMSTGLQEPLWDALPGPQSPILALAGDLDPKFTAIGQALATASTISRDNMTSRASHDASNAALDGQDLDTDALESRFALVQHAASQLASSGDASGCTFESVPGCGHAMLTEAPLRLLTILRRFFDRLGR